jgi:hypothetical protein
MISSLSCRMLEPVKTASGVHPWRLACGVAAIGVAAAGCASGPAGTVQAGGTHPGATPAASHAPASPGPKATTAPPAPPPAPHVVVVQLRTADGALVTVAAFRGPVQYVLHNGSGDPGAAAAGLVTAGPAVTGAERQRLLAAFNGGFKLSAGAGGYEQEGHVIATLRTGLASLVIDRSGQARIGIWGASVPAPGEAVYSVRQNLQPLVYRGQPTAAAASPGLWGATLGGGVSVARSAVGQDSSGDLLFAGSMAATPADLAQALAARGARIAMELDINPEWVQLDIARAPGGPLITAIPGQNRPASQFLDGWTRDFFTVLAAPTSG